MGYSKQKGACLFLLATCQVFFIKSQAYRWITPPSMCESSHTPTPLTGPAPPLPTLPQQYCMKVEANIIQKNWSIEVEEHFDSVNQRASVSITRNGTTTVSIFNFNTSERYDIFANGTCSTRPARVDFLRFVGTDRKNRPVMATVNDVFRFGAGFNMTYIGKEVVRGITVNHWTSCQSYDQVGAKFQLDYYFSDPDFTTAAGHVEIPVRAVLNGSAGSEKQGGTHTFQHNYEFMSFRSGTAVSEQVFQIPPGIVCSGRSDNKPLPPIPDQLEMSMEVIPDKGKRPRQEYLHYDYNHKLVETITTVVLTEGMDIIKVKKGQVKADNDNLFSITGSVVRDFTSRLIYTIEKTNMTCSVTKMPSSMTSETMAHGQSLLAVTNGNNKFMYQGQKTIRRMLVDVWAMEEGSVSTEVYFLPKLGSHPFQIMFGMLLKNKTSVGAIDMPKIFQMLQTDRNLGPPSDGQGLQDNTTAKSQMTIPPFPKLSSDLMIWGLQLEQLVDQHISQKMVNIFHYNPLHLDSTNFQVSQCYDEKDVSQVMLIIMANFDKDVQTNYAGFCNALRNSLAQKTGVSILHISNLTPIPLRLADTNKDATQVTFTLLGAAPVGGVQQKSIIKAKQDLEKAIANGITFHVQYATQSKDFMVDKSNYILDYNLYNSNSSLLTGPVAADEKSNIPGARYSSGAVAGIAIGTLILGAVVCLGALYGLYKWMHPGQPLIPKDQSAC